MHNWWRTRALGFHQETMKDPIQQMEDSTDISVLVFVSNLILFTQEITTSFGYNTKILNPSHYFNVSGNIIKKTQHLVIKVPVIVKQTVNRK